MGHQHLCRKGSIYDEVFDISPLTFRKFLVTLSSPRGAGREISERFHKCESFDIIEETALLSLLLGSVCLLSVARTKPRVRTRGNTASATAIESTSLTPPVYTGKRKCSTIIFFRDLLIETLRCCEGARDSRVVCSSKLCLVHPVNRDRLDGVGKWAESIVGKDKDRYFETQLWLQTLEGRGAPGFAETRSVK